MKLRDYQQECIDEILKLKGGDRKIVKSPTGSGKTVILSGLVNSISGRVLIVVPSTELREQTLEKLIAFCGDNIDVGSVQGKLDQVSSRIVVATRQSLTHSKSTRLSRIKEFGVFDYIIIDEAHQAINQQIKLIDGIANENTVVIGLTATPYNQDMNKVYSGIVFDRHILDMINDGHLVEPRAILVQSNTNIDNVHTVAGELNLGELEDTINNEDRNNLIVDSYLKYGNNRKHCLIFATGIDHAEAIVETFNKRGIVSYSVDSGCDAQERESIIQRFKNGEYKVLVNVGILTTGFDMNALDLIILARCTKSRILYEQIIGRALRTCENKKDALIIDIVDVTSKHDLMSISDVFNIDIHNGETPTEAIKRMRDMEENERRKLEAERLLREERLRKQAELIARQVELFNQNMKYAFYKSRLDWFKYDDFTFSLMATTTICYTIKQIGANEFVLYKILNNKTIKEMETSTNLREVMEHTESLALEHGNSFCRKDSKWKTDAATENQLKYIDKKLYWIKTKWDVNKYFYNRTLWKLLKGVM